MTPLRKNRINIEGLQNDHAGSGISEEPCRQGRISPAGPEGEGVAGVNRGVVCGPVTRVVE